MAVPSRSDTPPRRRTSFVTTQCETRPQSACQTFVLDHLSEGKLIVTLCFNDYGLTLHIQLAEMKYLERKKISPSRGG